MRTALLVCAMLLTLSGCSVTLTDSTTRPGHINDVNPGVGNDFRSREFKLNVSRGLLVGGNTINATINIDGTGFPMNGSGTGEWTYGVTDQDPSRPGAYRNYEYFYTVTYRANGQNREQHLPASGTKRMGYDPELFLERDDPIFFTSTATSKFVKLHNLSEATVTITNLEIAPHSGPGLGNTSGDKFTIVNPPPIPFVLQPQDGLRVEIGFIYSSVLTQGRLVIATDHPQYPEFEIAVQGKSF